MKQINENRKGYKKTPVGWIPDEWEVKNLSELGSFSKGSGITKEDLVEEGIPCIRYGEIYTTHDYIIKQFHSYISDITAKTSKLIKRGDILFAGSGETLEDIGKAVAYMGEDIAYAGGDVIIFSVIKISDSVFLSYLLNSQQIIRQKRKLGQGHSVVHIYAKDLGKLIIPYPKLNEKIKIANALSLWDTRIEKTQKLIDLKEKRKKALMQQLLTGKKRLKGFSGKWQKIKLQDLVEEFIVPMRDKPKLFRGTIPWCRIEDFNGKYLYDTKSNQFVDKETVKKMNLKIYPVNTVLVSCSANLGICAIVKRPLITNQTFIGLFANPGKLSFEFLYYIMSFKAHELNKLSSGTTISYLSREQFEKFKIIIPSLKEQIAVADFLIKTDEEIELLKHNLALLVKQKKGLMQVLLTGKVRIVNQNGA